MLRTLILLALLCAPQIVATTTTTGATETIGHLLRLSERDLAELLEAGTEPMTRGGGGGSEIANENPLQAWLADMATKARDGLHAKMNPERDWFALIRRTHDWFHAYMRVYDRMDAPNNKLLAPVDVLAREFARSDSELYAQKWAPDNLLATGSGPSDPKKGAREDEQKSIETIEYLYDALDKLMRRLETIDLDDPRAVARHLAAESVQTGDELRASREFREAVERVKRIGANTAEGVFKNEALVLVRMALVNVLAAQIGHLGGSDPTGQVGQLAALLLGATGPAMVVQYLADVNRRTLTTLLGVLNPLARFNEGVRRAPDSWAAHELAAPTATN